MDIKEFDEISTREIALSKEEITHVDNRMTLEQFKGKFLGKKSLLTSLYQSMREVPSDQKKDFGLKLTEMKNILNGLFEEKEEEMKALELSRKLESEKIDITLPGNHKRIGSKHPFYAIVDEVVDFFVGLGFSVASGPEVESDYNNFEMMNIPKDHPARDMQDTFYVDVNRLLRSQTTAIQMRVLEAQGNKLPIKVICPGKVYRRDDDDATHSHQFMQCEGLVIGENITVADLKGTLELMIKELFKNDAKIRFRPSYFPFTEPSFEVDMSCHKCGGKGCSICKDTGWIEILGSGMVHPNVLEAAGIDSKKYTGFAFGVGIERVAMLKYGVNDIRDFYTNDLRFLKGFKRSN